MKHRLSAILTETCIRHVDGLFVLRKLRKIKDNVKEKS